MSVMVNDIGKNLHAARLESGCSQESLAKRASLTQQHINFFEKGERTPSIAQLSRICRALDLPLQRCLSGSNCPAQGVQGIAIELRSLGMIDLWTEAPVVPGTFRNPEEVVALAVTGREPASRIIEGIPAILAWNRWNALLLRAFGRIHGRTTLYRLAWLADVVLAIHRTGGFPGGCPSREELSDFVQRVKIPGQRRWDDVGSSANSLPASPIWNRWKISYSAELSAFRQRAESLVELARAEGRSLPGSKG